MNSRFPHYSKLLRLYPKPYRKQYEQQMQQTLADMLDDPQRSKAGVWTRTAIDLPISLAREQLLYFGGAMTNEMPTFVKRNALISAALLAPFILILSANGADKVINNRTLYDDWLWHMPILAFWVLWLPLAATAIAVASLAVILTKHTKTEHTNWLKALLDIRHNWPLLATGFFGLFIVAAVFGHDSAHCVIGNPIHEAANWRQTWQCIRQKPISK